MPKLLIAGPVAIAPPSGLEVVPVTSAAEMKEAVDKHFSGADVTVMAAAVADFMFRAPAVRKVKKETLPAGLEIVRTPDILKELGGRKRPGQILVGFAAETNAVEAAARKKLREKNLDLIVANDVSREGTGFEADVNQAVLIDRRGKSRKTDILSKRALAAVIWDAVEGLREKKK